MMTKTDKIVFVEAPTATLEKVRIDTIDDVPAATTKARQTSLVELGQIDPVRLRPTQEGHYEIVDGRRRIANLKAARVDTVLAIIEPLTDEQADLYSLAQMGRSNNPMMEARKIAGLLDGKRSQEEIAKQLGVTQATISQRLALLDLIPELQSRLELGEITLATAKVARKLPTEDQRRLAAMDKVTAKDAKDLLRSYQAEMIDLSAIDIPDVNDNPGGDTIIELTPAQVEELANGFQVVVEVNGHQVILTTPF